MEGEDNKVKPWTNVNASLLLVKDEYIKVWKSKIGFWKLNL